MRSSFAALVGAICLVAAPVSAWSGTQARAPASYMYILMIDIIGPAANSLQDASERPALNDQEWERVKQMASRLANSATSLAFGGTSAEDGERAKSREWKNWTDRYTVGVSVVIDAAERKDKSALSSATAELVVVCNGCHMAFPQTVRAL